MKKGRHRRFEEARTLKLGQQGQLTVRDTSETNGAPEECPECGADPRQGHAAWCLAEAEELDEEA